MENKLHSLCSKLERSITSFFYNESNGRLKAFLMGLQVPLWIWTHQITAESERETRILQKTVNLVHWFYDNGVSMTNVAIIVPAEMKSKLRDQLVSSLQCSKEEKRNTVSEEVELPKLLGPHELTAMNNRDKVIHFYEVILYIFSFPPTSRFLPAAMQQEQFIGDSILSARGAFILIADVGWTSPHITINWPQWRTFIMKMQEETPVISYEVTTKINSDARLPSLIGPRIPLCCPKHFDQRQLEYGVAPILRTCKRLCLQPFMCKREGHVCTGPCHPRLSHLNCPYACENIMKCGHECLLSCSERCNCFEVIEKPLSCSHKIVIGLDQSNMQPIYATVQHIFKGVCSDLELPCAVEFITECARCIGPFKITCSEATQQNHTLENKTILCSSCIRLEREIRAKVLGEILVQAEEAKRRIKVEMQRTLHQQRKASSQGLFQEGSRVTICDVEKIVKPLCADADFPGVKFVDYDAPDFYSSMDGAYGTFVSRHVDIDDLSEVRNLIRLRDGQHVLVADGGVRLIRALTTAVTQQASTLLLTYNNKGNNNNTSNGVKSHSLDSTAFDKVKKMIGRFYYLAIPVPFGEEIISDKIVKVTALDPSSPDSVVVECHLTSVIQHADNFHENDSKRPRLEEELTLKEYHQEEQQQELGQGQEQQQQQQEREEKKENNNNHNNNPKLCATVTTITLTVPVAALETMEGYVAGKEVLVLEPSRQVTNPHHVEAFEALLAQTSEINLQGCSVSTVPVARDTPFILLGVVNAPMHLEKMYGPCAVLRRHVRLATVRPGRRGRSAATRFIPAGPPALATAVVLVPFVFTAADELLEAEGSLDAAALETFERRVLERVTEASEELALRHDEAAFHQQRQMPAPSLESLAAPRLALSCPMPLPSPETLAAVQTRHARLLGATPTSLRLSQQKDKLASRQQALGLAKWLEEVRAHHAQDTAANAAYFRGLQLNANSNYFSNK